MFGMNFDPIHALEAPRGGAQSLKKSPKIRFYVFKRKLREIRLQKLIINCWYGYCRYGEVGCDPKMGGGTLGG